MKKLIALLLALVLCLSLCACGGGNYKSAIDNYVSLLKGDFDKFEDLAPEEVWEFVEDEYDFDLEETIESMEEGYEEAMEQVEDEIGGKIKITYEVEKEKELKDSKLEDIAEGLEDRYDLDADVTAGYEIKEMTITVKGEDDEEELELDDLGITLTAIKIDGEWYLMDGDDEDADFLFINLMNMLMYY